MIRQPSFYSYTHIEQNQRQHNALVGSGNVYTQHSKQKTRNAHTCEPARSRKQTEHVSSNVLPCSLARQTARSARCCRAVLGSGPTLWRGPQLSNGWERIALLQSRLSFFISERSSRWACANFPWLSSGNKNTALQKIKADVETQQLTIILRFQKKFTTHRPPERQIKYHILKYPELRKSFLRELRKLVFNLNDKNN